MTGTAHGGTAEADLARLLEELGREPDERMSVCSLANGPFTARLTTVSAAPELAGSLGAGDVWFGTQVLHPRVVQGRGTANDVIGLRDLFVDLDVKAGGMPSWEAAEDVISALNVMLGVVPVAVVNSGHGLQPHWVIERGDATDWLDETDPRHGAAVGLFRRWGRLVAHVASKHGGKVDGVFDVSRVMRAPGTVNHKDPARPVPVTVDYRGGAPVSLKQLDETCDTYNVPEVAGDRDVLGEAVSARGTWGYAASTCSYVQAMVDGWASDTPAARHPWLLGQATRLAAAHRLGCLTETDHGAALDTLNARFLALLGTGTARQQTPGEVTDALAWGVARTETFTEARAAQDLGTSAKPHGPHRDEPDGVAEFWAARPILQHLHDFARARMVSPWSLLGVVLARVITATPPHVVLPALVGAEAGLNLFVALTGRSGGGKGASERAAAASIDVGPIEVATVGSGEGIAHLYAHREKGQVIRDRDAVLFTVPEVDNLTALAGRQGATLLPQLRMAWSGEKLGFSYADKTKALPIDAHSYRMGLILGVQPGKAAPLLDDADGGTPQRFLWLPTADPHAPDDPPTCPAPRRWKLPAPWHANVRGLSVMDVPARARETIAANRRAQLRGQGDALDGHALLTRLKTAAALALLEERQDINDEDWRLAGIVMAVSDRTRAGVVTYLAERQARANEFRGQTEGVRAVVVAESVERAKVQRASRSILRGLRKHGGWATARDVRAMLNSDIRGVGPEALSALADAGQIEVDNASGKPLYGATEGRGA